MKNAIIFKGTQEGITINLQDSIDFDKLILSLKDKIQDSKQYFGGSKTNIKITGRTLSSDEEQHIFDIISKEANLDINFMGTEKYFSAKPTEKIVEKVKYVEKIKEVPVKVNVSDKPFDSSNNLTYFHKGTLRSGDFINYEGSVVVIGDTNPGSEINAHGNIVVQGKIGGTVHAGCLGDQNCYVSAYNLSPIQLRIADKITSLPPEILKENKNSFIPRYAYIENEQITISKILKK